MKALVVGAVESTRVALNVITAAPGWSVAGLITLPPELAARHSDFSDLTQEVARADAPLIYAANSNAPAVLEKVRAIKPDIVCVIGWSQICKPAFLEAAGRVIGYHPAPLPQMRGRGAIPWTILLGCKITASTLFWMDNGVDSGPILAQRFLHVANDETATTLYQRHLVALGEVLAESLAAIASGKPPRIPQEEKYASWTAKRTPADGKIDWRRPADETWRLVRAVTRPYPGAFTASEGQKLVVWRAEPWPMAVRHAALPGQVIARQNGGFAVSCGDGNGLWVSEWETSSGKLPKQHSILGAA